MYQQGRLTHFASFSPKSYLAAAAESESANCPISDTIILALGLNLLDPVSCR